LWNERDFGLGDWGFWIDAHSNKVNTDRQVVLKYVLLCHILNMVKGDVHEENDSLY
jgi:hypothetical protein